MHILQSKSAYDTIPVPRLDSAHATAGDELAIAKRHSAVVKRPAGGECSLIFRNEKLLLTWKGREESVKR